MDGVRQEEVYRIGKNYPHHEAIRLEPERNILQLAARAVRLFYLSVDTIKFSTAYAVENRLVQSVMPPHSQAIVIDPESEDQQQADRNEDREENR